MPIKIIKQIRNIRNFINFYNSQHKFGEFYNIVYATNGVGKTTLSRIFSCWNEENQKFDLEKLEKLKSFEIEEKVLELKIEFFNNDIKNKFLIFNEDFINTKIITKIEDTSSGNITTEIKFEDENKRIGLKKIQIWLENFKRIEQNYQRLLNFEINKKYNKELNRLKDIYNKRNFKIYIKNINDLKNINTNNQENYEEKLEKLKNINDDDKIKYNFKNLEYDFLELLNNDLYKEHNFDDIDKDIERYINDIGRKWIEDGIKNSENVNGKCPFCQKNIEDELIKKYNNVLNSEKTKFIKKLEGYKDYIEKLYATIKDNITESKTIHYIIVEKSKLLDLEFNNFDQKKVNELLEDFTLIKKEILIQIDKKISNIHDSITIKREELMRCLNEFEEIFELLSKDSSSINKKLENTRDLRKYCIQNIFNNKLKEFYDNNYNIFYLIENNKNYLENIDKYYNNINEQLKLLPQTTKERVKLKLNFCNNLIKDTTLNNKYTVSNNWTIKLKEKECTNPKEHFSTSERNILVFIYFLSCILDKIEKYSDLNSLTLIIDDPVSSMDYNNFYYIIGLIKNINKYLEKIFDVKDNDTKLQVIILTHNAKLFNLLSAIKYEANKIEKFELTNKALDIKAPMKSEYLTILERINKVVKNLKIYEKAKNKDSISEEIKNNRQVFGADIRYILETIVDFFNGKNCGDNLLESIYKIFPNIEIESEKIRDLLINDCCHSTFQKNIDYETYMEEVNETAKWLIDDFIKKIFKFQLKD